MLVGNFTVKQVRDTLDLSECDEAKTFLPYVSHMWWENPDNDLIIFDVGGFYGSILSNIDIVLDEFTKAGLKAMSVKQIGKALDKADEPWPDYVIVHAMQLRLLAVQNRFYPAKDVMEMSFR